MATVVAMPQSAPIDIAEPAWAEAIWLPCQMSVEIPVQAFTLGDLLSLKVNSVVDTRTASDSSVPLTVNGASIATGKFDITNDCVAVRLTDIE